MAKMTIKGADELALKLSKLGGDVKELTKKVIWAGANPVADEVRKNLEANINDPSYVGKGDGVFKTTESTGDLLDSMGVAPPSRDKNGNTNTKIGFEGYDRNGVPNALKARAMESGTSVLKKRPFVRPAVNKMKKRAIDEMSKKFDEEMKIYSL